MDLPTFKCLLLVLFLVLLDELLLEARVAGVKLTGAVPLGGDGGTSG